MSISMPVHPLLRRVVPAVFSAWVLAAASGLSYAADAAEIQNSVAGHLAAGEFGAALDAAGGIADAAQRDAVLQQIVNAQLQAGDLPGALASTTQISDRTARTQQRAEVGEAATRGSGTGADFDQLIDLILEETEGPWESIDGIGGPDPREFESGVRVDPRGLLYKATEKEVTGQLEALGIRARTADLNTDMARRSNLRMVSLTRLQEAVAQRLAQGQPAVESMRQLAGLSQIQYVFLYPEGEVVIAGPAEGWKYNEYGQPVGAETGRPTLQLDDLVTVLRTFSPNGQQIFGCSIDPRPEGLAAIREFASASQARGPLSAGSVGRWAKQLGEQLGPQDISVYGIPGDSRVARVIVEADYRMKLIGVGKLSAGPHVPDYFDLLAKNPEVATGSLDALRWWLTMHYDAVMHSDSRNAFEIRGSSVQCMSENQFVTEQGQRVETGKAEPINRQFAQTFSEHYAEIAQRDPVFADLQGVFDLALVAALLQQERVTWDRGVFDVNGSYHTASYSVPKETDSVVSHRVFNGRDVVVQVAGGVRADLLTVLNDGEVRQQSPRLDNVAEGSKAQSNLPEGRWWWDAN
ncbi:MAG: DUF1598 domain-containing protein [Planctomycetaceae bacterium]|nr:DUF1598 domain-containing protein [Planctomycetaceae bacterium]